MNFIIYSEKSSPRLIYVLDYIFTDMAGLNYSLTTDLDFYRSSEAYKINYSEDSILDYEFHLHPHGFLFDNDLNACKFMIVDFENTKALFASNRKCHFPFDIFSAVFYMLSRFEEYQPYIKDAHGRFKPHDSIASKHNFLNKPVVNIWIDNFINQLNLSFKLNITVKRKYMFINTIDIDIAYSYKHKGIYRNFYGYLRSLKQLNLSEMLDRWQVVMGLKQDPYDSYSYILEMHEKFNLQTIFFIHVGDYGVYDKNIPYKNNKFRDLIRHLSDYAEIGIHPSYDSSTNPEKLQIEIDRLSDIIRKDITKSRQHFLRLTFPCTYRNLVDNKIKEDYSLGYASEIGFRAGVCTPFKFYDLDSDKPTSLLIRPFSIMDGTLKDYLKMDEQAAIDSIEYQINEIKNANGEFISLWHNESLSDNNRWEGWRSVYEKMINKALP